VWIEAAKCPLSKWPIPGEPSLSQSPDQANQRQDNDPSGH
jgi:hypothetical protein